MASCFDASISKSVARIAGPPTFPELEVAAYVDQGTFVRLSYRPLVLAGSSSRSFTPLLPSSHLSLPPATLMPQLIACTNLLRRKLITISTSALLMVSRVNPGAGSGSSDADRPPSAEVGRRLALRSLKD